MKIGIEVEGRYKGLKTLFCKASDLTKDLNYNVQQIYISDHGNELDLKSTRLLELSQKYLVTVEVTKVLEAPPAHVHVLLCIDSSSVWLLKATDQVKFSHNLTVLTATIENCIKTVPEDFDGDVDLGD